MFAALTSCLVTPWDTILGFRLPVKKKKQEVIFWNDEGNWGLEWKYVEGSLGLKQADRSEPRMDISKA